MGRRNRDRGAHRNPDQDADRDQGRSGPPGAGSHSLDRRPEPLLARSGLGPLGMRLAAAFLAVALSAIAVFAVVIVLVDRGDVSGLAATRRAETTRYVAVALKRAYTPAGQWPAADLQPAVALAESAGAGLRLDDADGRPVLKSGSQALFSDRSSTVTSQVLTAGSRPIGRLSLAFPSGGLDTADRHLRSALATAVGWTAALVALGSILVTVLVSRSILRPIRRLTEAIRAFGAGHGTARVGDRAGPGELGQLGRAFDTMAASLQREDDLRRAIVADVAHELRTPIAVLQAETEALMDGVSEPSTAALSSLHDEALRLGRMVEDLQTLASAEAAGLTLELRRLDLSRVAADAADSLSGRFRAAGVLLEQELPPVAVMGDPHRLHQVVANLLGNAVKFTPGGGRVELKVGADGADAVIQVADTGPGVAEAERPLIWRRFYRGAAGRTAAGSGIGLAVVRELVEAHGGTVHVDRADSGGARFVVRLPLADSVR